MNKISTHVVIQMSTPLLIFGKTEIIKAKMTNTVGHNKWGNENTIC
jgi:hypothetical protein